MCCAATAAGKEMKTPPHVRQKANDLGRANAKKKGKKEINTHQSQRRSCRRAAIKRTLCNCVYQGLYWCQPAAHEVRRRMCVLVLGGRSQVLSIIFQIHRPSPGVPESWRPGVL